MSVSKATATAFAKYLASTAPHQAKCDMPGSIEVSTDPAVLATWGCASPVPPKAVGFYVNYADDGLSGQEVDDLVNWYDQVWSAIHTFAAANKLTSVGDDLDGSGGGLYYGASIFV